MKKFFMIAVMAVAALSANAQVFIGGGVGFNSSSSKTDGSDNVTTTSFNVAPEVGYQFGNVAVGVRFTYETEKQTDCDASNIFGIGAFGLYNFVNSEKFHFGGELSVNYVNYKAVYNGKAADESCGGFNISLAPVFTYDVSEKTALFAKFNLFEYTKFGEKYGKLQQVNFGLFNSANLEMGVKFSL